MKNKNTKLALITLGSIIVIGTPAIVIGSIYAYNTSKMTPQEKDLIDFFEAEESSLFQKNNFIISEPEPNLSGQHLVENVVTKNITFSKENQLKNYSYKIEITKVIPTSQSRTLVFDYVIYSIIDPSVKISKVSQFYSEYMDSFDKYKQFD